MSVRVTETQDGFIVRLPKSACGLIDRRMADEIRGMSISKLSEYMASRMAIAAATIHEETDGMNVSWEEDVLPALGEIFGWTKEERAWVDDEIRKRMT